MQALFLVKTLKMLVAKVGGGGRGGLGVWD